MFDQESRSALETQAGCFFDADTKLHTCKVIGFSQDTEIIIIPSTSLRVPYENVIRNLARPFAGAFDVAMLTSLMLSGSRIFMI